MLMPICFFNRTSSWIGSTHADPCFQNRYLLIGKFIFRRHCSVWIGPFHCRHQQAFLWFSRHDRWSRIASLFPPLTKVKPQATVYVMRLTMALKTAGLQKRPDLAFKEFERFCGIRSFKVIGPFAHHATARKHRASLLRLFIGPLSRSAVGHRMTHSACGTIGTPAVSVRPSLADFYFPASFGTPQ